MKIDFTIYRSKNPDEEINSGIITQPIEDTMLITLDTYINKLIIAHIRQLDIIKRYGLAYVGSIKLNSLEVTDEDDIELNETGFKTFIDGLFTNVRVKWSKVNKNKEKKCIKQPEKQVVNKKKE